MKKIELLIIAILSFAAIGCSDFLDKQPDDMKTDQMVWSSRTQVLGYLANIYAGIPSQATNTDAYEGLSDECDYSWTVYPTFQVNLGNWNPTTNLYNKYATWYEAIRSSFVFENNVDKCPEISEDLKKQYKAEAKFLRGYFYWLLLRQYGPFVLIDKKMDTDADYVDMERTPFDQCVNYICQMMDEAAANLPLHWQDRQVDFGRPNQIVCKAVKAIVLTYAASPQWNGNKEYSDFKNPDGTPLVNTTYDESKWKKAADACKEVINISEQHPEANLRLYKNNENGDGTSFNPYKSLIDVQLKPWNCEIIFGRTNSDMMDWMIHCSPGPKNLGGIGPTQRLVDAFFMDNGKPIDDPTSGYIPTGFCATPNKHWNPNNRNVKTEDGRKAIIGDIRNSDAWGQWTGDWNMYANREPRFYAAILYNGRIIPQLPDDIDKRNYFSSSINGQKDGFGRAELYYGGQSRESGSYTFFSRTGYLALKKCDPQANMYDRILPGKYMQPTIRYARILLDYIEALNEYDPKNADIRKYWDLIRDRAGIPSVFEAMPQITGNQDLQRKYILQERMVELCFENDRYFTTRRRWVADTPDDGSSKDNRIYGDGGRMWGMDIDAGSTATNSFKYTGFYNEKAFETRVFKKAYYLFPIPQTEIDKSEGHLVQNPWW